MSQTMWLVVAVSVCLSIVIAWQTGTAAAKAPIDPVEAATACSRNGHGLRYQAPDGEWYCATCDARLPWTGSPPA